MAFQLVNMDLFLWCLLCLFVCLLFSFFALPGAGARMICADPINNSHVERNCVLIVNDGSPIRNHICGLIDFLITIIEWAWISNIHCTSVFRFSFVSIDSTMFSMRITQCWSRDEEKTKSNYPPANTFIRIPNAFNDIFFQMHYFRSMMAIREGIWGIIRLPVCRTIAPAPLFASQQSHAQLWLWHFLSHEKMIEIVAHRLEWKSNSYRHQQNWMINWNRRTMFSEPIEWKIYMREQQQREEIPNMTIYLSQNAAAVRYSFPQ